MLLQGRERVKLTLSKASDDHRCTPTLPGLDEFKSPSRTHP
jgi:hypothetical protein